MPISRVSEPFLCLNGTDLRLLGGAIHYARVPVNGWRDRFSKLIDLGANAVETYCFWNAHEPYPTKYRFDGMLDVVRFVELAGSMGLHVIVRPGPYCCAEWEMGGLPWWLLRDPDMQLRSSHPSFLAPVESWWSQLIPRLAPLQSTRGGPIIGMQIENEYGYYGNDRRYLESLRDLLRRLDVDVPLFTSDGSFQRITMAKGGLDDLFRTANFGSRAEERFKTLREFQPTGPLVCMEFWVGWFDEWRAAKHSTRPAAEVAQELDQLLALGASAVIYMFHGGTNWGFSAGGNLHDRFVPFVTSYDYDALLDEAGDVTPKFLACRDVIRRHLKLDRPVMSHAPSAKAAYGTIALTEYVSLDDVLPSLAAPVESSSPLAFEQLGHGRGFVVYRTSLDAIYRGESLVIRGMHDWCHIRLNGKSLATWYRNDPPPKLTLDFDTPTAELEILVHNLARSNFGHQMNERKGITEGVFIGPARHDERGIYGWTHWPLPLDEAPVLPFGPRPADAAGPGFFCGRLTIDGAPADTYLSLPGFDLGCVFINGFNVGRYWSVGPQQTLYVPAEMLRPGDNEIVVFDATVHAGTAVVSVDRPVLETPAPVPATS